MSDEEEGSLVEASNDNLEKEEERGSDDEGESANGSVDLKANENDIEEEEEEEDKKSKKGRKGAGKKVVVRRGSAPAKASRRRTPIIDIPIELVRRSHRTPVKPTRYAEKGKDDEKNEDEEEDEDKEKEDKEVEQAAKKLPPKKPRAKPGPKPKRPRKEEEETKEVKKDESEDKQEEEKKEEQGDQKAPRATKRKTNPNAGAAATRRNTQQPAKPSKRAKITATWDPAQNKSLAQEYPDGYWAGKGGIEYVNRSHPLKLVGELHHPGFIYGMVWSNDGTLLATCSTLGTIRIWDVDTWQNIQELKDEKEERIEEFYVMKFTPDDMLLFTAGKLKDRDKWSEEDDDNAVAPGPIKLFDVVTGEVVGRFDSHEEEILSLKMVNFKGENYLLSASQDGYIIKWHFDETWRNCLGSKRIDEVTTNMALCLSFLPNCGNKYFMAAADEGIKIYDFEAEVLLQKFEELYTSYCDCLKFIDAKEFEHVDGEYYLITRGVELLSEDDPAKVLQPNTCHLRKLVAPKKSKTTAYNAFTLETVTTFMHPNYQANSWPVRVSSNGRYMVAPTVQGEVFVWNLRTGDLVSILADHNDRETRDITFHPTRPFLLTCCDDSTCKIYSQDPIPEGEKMDEGGGLVEVVHDIPQPIGNGTVAKAHKRKAAELEAEDEEHFGKIEKEWKKLETQMSSVEKGWVELNRAKEKFNKEKRQFADSKKRLAADQKQLEEEKAKVIEAWADIEQARLQIDEAKAQLTSLQEDQASEKSGEGEGDEKQKKEKRLLDAISKIQELSQKKDLVVLSQSASASAVDSMETDETAAAAEEKSSATASSPTPTPAPAKKAKPGPPARKPAASTTAEKKKGASGPAKPAPSRSAKGAPPAKGVIKKGAAAPQQKKPAVTKGEALKNAAGEEKTKKKPGPSPSTQRKRPGPKKKEVVEDKKEEEEEEEEAKEEKEEQEEEEEAPKKGKGKQPAGKPPAKKGVPPGKKSAVPAKGGKSGAAPAKGAAGAKGKQQEEKAAATKKPAAGKRKAPPPKARGKPGPKPKKKEEKKEEEEEEDAGDAEMAEASAEGKADDEV